MSSIHIFIALLVAGAGVIAIYWVAYQTGRLHGYEVGMKKGVQLNAQVQHLKGMSDGYVMAMQHTPAQRHEYMNNVLLRTGAITEADIEADRRWRQELEAARPPVAMHF